MRDEWVRTIRTTVQTLVAVAATVPVLAPALGLSAFPIGVAIVAIAATVTRISQIPQVAELLNKYFKVPMP